MDFHESRQSFIEKWGALGINWGVNRILGQIHGLLLTSCQPMCSDDIMEYLDISRGSANTNLRILQDWNLVHKAHVTESRKEFFVAEKDMWTIFVIIVKQRRKKELDPLLESLKVLANLQPSCQDSQEFSNMVESIDLFSRKVDKALNQIVKEKPNMIVSAYLKS